MKKIGFILLILIVLLIPFGYWIFSTNKVDLPSFININKDNKNITTDISVKSGSCLIVEEKNCNLSKSFLKDQEIYSINYFLPKNTKILSPIDGDIAIKDISLGNGKFIKNIIIGTLGFNDPNQVNVLYVYYLTDSRINESVISNKKVKKGEIIAYTNDSRKISDVENNMSFQVMDASFKDNVFSQKVNTSLLINTVGKINDKK